ncbi:MAG: hypothetical protein V1662_06270 [Candidatus Omnitrophota bacterium]
MNAPFAPEQQSADPALPLLKTKQVLAQNRNSKIESFTKKLDKKCVVSLPEFNSCAPLFLQRERTVINPGSIIGTIGNDSRGEDSLKKLSLDTENLPELLQREIIFQPPFPKYYELTEPKPTRSYAIFKIFISAAGTIDEITNVKLSGNPEMDMTLARYIKKWRFAPAFGPDGQWQTVKINLHTGVSAITTCENKNDKSCF